MGRSARLISSQGTLVCVDCKQEKNFTEFGKKTAAPSGRQSRCKSCDRVVVRKPTNPALRKKSDPMKTWKYRIKSRFQISPEEYAWLLERQNGKCALCFQDACFKRQVLSIDHFHGCLHHANRVSESLKERDLGCKLCIRGLLCDRCNMVLGLLEKSPHLQNDLARHYISQRPFTKVEKS